MVDWFAGVLIGWLVVVQFYFSVGCLRGPLVDDWLLGGWRLVSRSVAWLAC